MNQNTPVNKPNQTDAVKRGRKPFLVVWPEGEFTASKVSLVNNTVSKVSVHAKINEAMARGELVLIRRIKNGLGRPQAVYSRIFNPLGVEGKLN